jgi:hypothetical protein
MMIKNNQHFNVGDITILNYSHIFKPKWIKIKSFLADNQLAIVYMQTEDGTQWIDHHYVVSTKSLGFFGQLPYTSKSLLCRSGTTNKDEDKKLKKSKNATKIITRKNLARFLLVTWSVYAVCYVLSKKRI